MPITSFPGQSSVNDLLMWQCKEQTPWLVLGTSLKDPPGFGLPRGDGGSSVTSELQLILSLCPTLLSVLPLHRWWLHECPLITPQETHLWIRVCVLGSSSHFCRCQEDSDKADSRTGFWSWMTCHQLVIKRPLADCRWSIESPWHIISVQLSKLPPVMYWDSILVQANVFAASMYPAGEN